MEVLHHLDRLQCLLYPHCLLLLREYPWLVCQAPVADTVQPETSGRTLEDLDAYYRTKPSALVFRDKDATSSTRPEKYIENEQEQIRKNPTYAGANGEKVTDHFRHEERRDIDRKGGPSSGGLLGESYSNEQIEDAAHAEKVGESSSSSQA